MLADQEIRFIYGKTAVISRKGAFTLVHLDAPSKSVVRQRTRAFNPDRYFFDDCPLCQLAKEGGVIVFDAPIEPADG